MKNNSIMVLIVLLIAAQSLTQAAFAQDDTETITLPAGTPIRLEMQEQLYSQRNHEGDEILFLVSEDVVMMGQTYLVAGTPVVGRVTHTRPARSWGRSGNIDIEITSIMPLYSMPIGLSGEAGGSGGSQTAASIGTTVLLGISVVGLLAGGSISGSGAVIEAGTDLTVFSANEAEIMDIPEEEMQEIVDEWLTDQVITDFLNYSWDSNCTIEQAIQSLGFTIDETMIRIEPTEDFYYRVTVQLSDTQSACFTLRPFQEAHLGKFITLECHDDMAVQIFRAVR